MSSKHEAAKTKIIALLGSGISHTEIAKAAGCSSKTVQRIARSIKPTLDEIKDLLSEYRRLFHKELPIPDRVELYTRIARKVDKNPFAAMRALERVDDLDGILTAKDEIRRPPENSGEHRPMFILPAGTNVQVNILQADNPITKAVDVTPRSQSKGKTE
jgi:hypothetical protein